MKRLFFGTFALAMLFAGAAAFGQGRAADGQGNAPAVQAKAVSAGAMTVQVGRAQIWQAPSVVAPVLASLAYKDKVVVLGSSEGWAKVQVPGSAKVGYMFMSALTQRPVSSSAAEAAVPGITASEIALAGKGFNDSVEESFRKSTHIDYAFVDAMEAYAYPPDEAAGFLSGASGDGTP